MKFTRINEDYQVLSVEIKDPEEYSNITYYYPDGITKGLFRRNSKMKLRRFVSKEELEK